MGHEKWDNAVKENRTIDEIFKTLIDSDKSIPGEEIISEVTGWWTSGNTMDIVPSALSLDETEIELTGTHLGNPIESEWKKRSLICEWIEQNSLDERYDYIIFDCPPATKIVTQNALATSHGYIVPVIPDAVSIRGTPHLTELMLNKIEKQFNTLTEFLKTRDTKIVSTYVPSRTLVGLVVNRVKSAYSATGYTNDISQHLRNLKRIYPNGEIIEPYIPEGVGISESMTARAPVYYLKGERNIGGRGFPRTFEKISKELLTRIDGI